MKVLVVGSSGMLGTDVVSGFESRGWEVAAPSETELDLTRPESIREVVSGQSAKGAEWCVNCAAYTAVDKAEEEFELAHAVNAAGPGYLAATCEHEMIRLLHLSTDYVFDGKSRTPYLESSSANPLGIYAKTKLEGEIAVLDAQPAAVIARTAWLYGPKGQSFPRSMIRAWLAGKELKVVIDQIGSPTYTSDLARTIADMIEKNAPAGIYHTVGPDIMNRNELAALTIRTYRDVVLKEDRTAEVGVSRMADWPTPAPRPASCVLDSEKLPAMGIAPMRNTAVALAEFCKRLGKNP